MLIQFSVSNFRSFREEQTLSMVAAPRIKKRDNTFKPPLDEKFADLLKVAVIYGPNASGKSNLLKAMHALIGIATREPRNSNKKIPVQRFAFDPSFENEPSKFEVHFIANKLRYEFILHTNEDRIIKEQLTSFPKGKEEILYIRDYSEEESSYLYKYPSLLDDELTLKTWERITPKDVLFLSQMVSNNEKPRQDILAAYTWLSVGWMCHLDGAKQYFEATKKMLTSDYDISEKARDFYAKNLTKFLRDFDVPISSIEYVEKDRTEINKNNTIASSNETPAKREILFTHDTNLGKYRINFEDQSDGTQSLVSFWIPWMHTQTREEGIRSSTLIVDELDSSLHPLIVESLVKKHISKDNSTSQLIFTTHDTHLMNSKILRRDQIWITDRDSNGATNLSSVHDYEGREGEDIEKRYYEGRYKGLPHRRS
ncbi:AAA family ATPase [Comamonas sp. Z3]|nr:AAA family ATPase [Comamonas sp. Z3]